MERIPPHFPIAHNLGLLTKRYLEVLSKRLKNLSIERHYLALMIVGEHDGELCQGELGQRLSVDKVITGRVVNYLVDQGFLERLEHPNDKRYHLLGLTEQGREAEKEIRLAFEELNESCFRGIPQSERDYFKNVLDKMMTNLNAEPGEAVALSYERIKPEDA